MILVVTRELDAHASRLVGELESRGEAVRRLQFADFPQRMDIDYHLHAGEVECRLCFHDGLVLDSRDVKSVFNRRPTPAYASQAIRAPEVRAYVERESQAVIDALPQVLSRAVWLSHPDKIAVAGRKPYQLGLAADVGFEVPPTLVTNSPEAAAVFLEGIAGDLAVKSVCSPGATVRKRGGAQRSIALFTTRLTKSELLADLAMVRNCPVIIQPYVEKRLELRVTVVGGDVFACAIHSQLSERTRTDWRRYDLANTPHERCDLPPEIAQRCVRLVRSAGLAFGCIDLILTPDGRYVFLEVNPNGQWLWIEDLTGLPITAAIADLLSGAPEPATP